MAFCVQSNDNLAAGEGFAGPEGDCSAAATCDGGDAVAGASVSSEASGVLFSLPYATIVPLDRFLRTIVFCMTVVPPLSVVNTIIASDRRGSIADEAPLSLGIPTREENRNGGREDFMNLDANKEPNGYTYTEMKIINKMRKSIISKSP